MRNFRDRPEPSVKILYDIRYDQRETQEKFQPRFGPIRGSAMHSKMKKLKMVNTLLTDNLSFLEDGGDTKVQEKTSKNILDDSSSSDDP